MSLAATYLGLSLSSPLVASSSPLTGRLDSLRRLEDAGVGAVVLPSLFEEQIEAEADARASRIDAHAESSPEAASYFPGPPGAAGGPYGVRPQRYLDLVRRGAEAVSIPLIASLNGASSEGWIEYARLIEQAGAKALELNMYHVPTDLAESGREVEARYAAIVQQVCASVSLPVAVKLTPYLSAIGHFATSLTAHGAAGLVLFNRLMEPDIDLSRMKLTDAFELSEPAEMRLALLWIAILSGRAQASLAASTGVATCEDVVKYLLAGADVVMTTSALLRNGVGYAAKLLEGLRQWMDAREIGALADMRGVMSWERSRDRSAYTRANYIRILERAAHSF